MEEISPASNQWLFGIDELDRELATLQRSIARLRQTQLRKGPHLADESGSSSLSLSIPSGKTQVCETCGERFHRLRTMLSGTQELRVCHRCKTSTYYERVQRAVQVILDERGFPMHLNEIHASLLVRHVHLPGRGRPENVSLCISTMDTQAVFYKPAKGTYGLSKWLPFGPTACHDDVAHSIRKAEHFASVALG